MSKAWGILLRGAALSLLIFGCSGADRGESIGVQQAAIDTGQALVIRQVYARPDIPAPSLGTFNRDYVEIYNKGSSPASLTGLSVQRALLNTNFSFRLILPSVTVAPGQSYLVAGPVVDASPSLPVQPDIVVTGTPNGQFIPQVGAV